MKSSTTMLLVGGAAVAAVAAYFIMKKPGAPQMQQSNAPPPAKGQGAALTPPASAPEDKNLAEKGMDEASKLAKNDADCYAKFPDRESMGYITCMASKGL